MSATISEKKKFLICGFLFLCLGSFLDSSRGPLLPLFAQSLELPYQKASWFLVIGCLFSVLSLLMLPKLLARLGDRKTSFALGLVGLSVCVVSLFVDSFAWVLALGALIGIVGSCFGTLANIFVIEGAPLHRRAQLLCALHVMYGVGSFLAPASIGLILKHEFSWRAVFFLSSFCLLFLLFPLLRSLPKPSTRRDDVPQGIEPVSLIQIIALLAFATYAAGEILISTWMTAYLVQTQDLTISQAAPYLTGFFLVMAASRALCFFSLRENQVKFACWFFLIASVGFFSLGHAGFLWAFPLSGLFGPFFPLFTSIISHDFPNQWRNFLVWLILFMQATLGLMHLGAGRITDSIGIEQTYLLPYGFLAMTFVCLIVYFRWQKNALTRRAIHAS